MILYSTNSLPSNGLSLASAHIIYVSQEKHLMLINLSSNTLKENVNKDNIEP